MNILERLNKSGDKITFYYDFGRGAGQCPSTGIFIYTEPKNQIERNHNKEALGLLETKKSQLILEQHPLAAHLSLRINSRLISWITMRSMCVITN